MTIRILEEKAAAKNGQTRRRELSTIYIFMLRNIIAHLLALHWIIVNNILYTHWIGAENLQLCVNVLYPMVVAMLSISQSHINNSHIDETQTRRHNAKINKIWSNRSIFAKRKKKTERDRKSANMGGPNEWEIERERPSWTRYARSARSQFLIRNPAELNV